MSFESEFSGILPYNYIDVVKDKIHAYIVRVATVAVHSAHLLLQLHTFNEP